MDEGLRLEEIKDIHQSMTELEQINSQTIKGSWKEFELYPVISDRRLELVRHGAVVFVEGSLWGSIESRMEENKREVVGTQQGGCETLLTEDHGSDSK